MSPSGSVFRPPGFPSPGRALARRIFAGLAFAGLALFGRFTVGGLVIAGFGRLVLVWFGFGWFGLSPSGFAVGRFFLVLAFVVAGGDVVGQFAGLFRQLALLFGDLLEIRIAGGLALQLLLLFDQFVNALDVLLDALFFRLQTF